MSNQQFSEKAQKLFDRLNNISLQTYNNSQRNLESCLSGFSYPNKTTSNTKMNTYFSQTNKTHDRELYTDPSSIQKKQGYSNSSPQTQSPQSQFLNQLIKFDQSIRSDEEQNSQKIVSTHQQLKKFEIFLNDQNDTRNKLHQNFVQSVLKLQKNMEIALNNTSKIYLERQKKLQSKIDNIIKMEKKNLEEKLDQYANIDEQISKISQAIKGLHVQLNQMRKSRVELEDRIFTQFNDQLKKLKHIFDQNVKNREERQMRILNQLKKMYKDQSDIIKTEQITRESNQKMFLKIIEQLIDRISEA